MESEKKGIEDLMNIGFSNFQSKIINEILKNSPVTVREIVEGTMIHRSNVHNSFNLLKGEGLIQEYYSIHKGKRRRKIIVSPDCKKYFENKRKSLENVEKRFEEKKSNINFKKIEEEKLEKVINCLKDNFQYAYKEVIKLLK